MSDLPIDVFISYHHSDNQAGEDGEGWVSNLHSGLHHILRQYLGHEVKIWRDSRLQGDAPVDESLDALAQSKVMVCVISPAYLLSEWCAQEIREFSRWAWQSGGVRVENRSRLFAVAKTFAPREDYPPLLKSMLGYDFYSVDPQTGRPREYSQERGGYENVAYWERIRQLGWDIATVMGMFYAGLWLPPGPGRKPPKEREKERQGPAETASRGGEKAAGARRTPEREAEPAPAAGPGSHIFISYRREEAEGHAGRLFDSLSDHFGAGAVFMDVDTIQPGEDFVEAIERAVGACQVLIAIVGKNWLGVTDADGGRRLDNPEDFVHLEIATALERKIRLIPVLIQGATMPQSKNLPEALRGLARRNALELSSTRWKTDIEKLVKVLEDILGEPKPA